MYSRLSSAMTPAQKLELLKKEMIRLATEKETPQSQGRNLEIEQEFDKLRQGILDLGNALTTSDSSGVKTPQAKKIVVTPRRIVKKSSSHRSPMSGAPAFSPPKFIRRFPEPVEPEKPSILTPAARSVLASIEAKKSQVRDRQEKVSSFLEKKETSPKLESFSAVSSSTFKFSNRITSSSTEEKQPEKRRKIESHQASSSFISRTSDNNPFSITKNTQNFPSSKENKFSTKVESPQPEVLTPTARAMKARLEALADAKQQSPKRATSKSKSKMEEHGSEMTLTPSTPPQSQQKPSEVLTPTGKAIKATLMEKKAETPPSKSPDAKNRESKVLTPTGREIQEKMSNQKKEKSPVKGSNTEEIITPTARVIKTSSMEKSPSNTASVPKPKTESKMKESPFVSAVQCESKISESRKITTITETFSSAKGSPKKVVQYLTSKSKPQESTTREKSKDEDRKSTEKLTPTARAMQAMMEAKKILTSGKSDKPKVGTPKKHTDSDRQSDKNSNAWSTNSADTPKSKHVHFSKKLSLDLTCVPQGIGSPQNIRGIIKPPRLTRRALHPEKESPKIRSSKRGRVSFGENTLHTDSEDEEEDEDDIKEDEEEEDIEKDEEVDKDLKQDKQQVGNVKQDKIEVPVNVPQVSESVSESVKVSRRVSVVAKSSGRKRQMSSSDEEEEEDVDSLSSPIVSSSKRRRTYVTTPHPVKGERQSLKVTVSKNEDEDEMGDEDADVSDASDVVKVVSKRNSTRKSSRKVKEVKTKRAAAKPKLRVTVTEQEEDEDKEKDEDKEDDKDSDASDAVIPSKKTVSKKSSTTGSRQKSKPKEAAVKKVSKRKRNDESSEQESEEKEEPVVVSPVKKKKAAKKKAVVESNEESDVTEDSLPSTPRRKRRTPLKPKMTLPKVEEVGNEDSEDSVQAAPNRRTRSLNTKLFKASDDSTNESDDSTRSTPTKRRRSSILSSTKVGFSKDGPTMEDIPEDKEVELTTSKKPVKRRTVKSRSKTSDTEEDSDSVSTLPVIQEAQESEKVVEESNEESEVTEDAVPSTPRRNKRTSLQPKEKKPAVIPEKITEASKQNLTPAARAVLAKMMAAQEESSKKTKKKIPSKEPAVETEGTDTESNSSLPEKTQRKSRRRSNIV